MRILQGLLVLIILGLQIRLWTGPGSLAEISRLNDSIAVQESENTELEDRNTELLTEVEELKTGSDAIEEIARQDLGLIKEGETFYMIVDQDNDDKPADTIEPAKQNGANEQDHDGEQ